MLRLVRLPIRRSIIWRFPHEPSQSDMDNLWTPTHCTYPTPPRRFQQLLENTPYMCYFEIYQPPYLRDEQDVIDDSDDENEEIERGYKEPGQTKRKRKIREYGTAIGYLE